MSGELVVEKECGRCGRTLPANSFYRHGRNNSALRGTCKDCKREMQKSWSAANRESERASTKRYKAKYPDRRRAASKVLSSVRSGELVPGPCAVCGTTDGPHAHHESYDKKDWLDVIWLCHLHHRRVHTTVRCTRVDEQKGGEGDAS